tara:strand:- start:99 stop:383 length:285 start_codon:yes stop_codon:yes gene_type:complete
MDIDTKELLKEIKAYRNDMVARNYPHQQISDIITKWEMKRRSSNYKDFLEEAEKEKKELEESYKESVRQTKERKTPSEQAQDELEPITSPMSDE